MNNLVALSYLVKMGKGRGGEKSRFSGIKQTNLEYLISKQIILTAEHLPWILNVMADFESRNVKDPNEWMLNREIFEKLCSNLDKPDIHISLHRVSKQLKKCISLKTDQFSMGRDAFQTSWSQGLNYAFASFRLIGTVLAKIQKEKATLILVIPANIQNPILLPS